MKVITIFPFFFTRMRLRRRWQRQPRLSGLRKLLHPAGEGQQPFEQQLQQRAPTTAATAATEALWLGREAAGRRQPSLQVRVKMGVSHAPKQFTLNGSLSKDFETCFGCTLHCRKFNWRLQKKQSCYRPFLSFNPAALFPPPSFTSRKYLGTWAPPWGRWPPPEEEEEEGTPLSPPPTAPPIPSSSLTSTRGPSRSGSQGEESKSFMERQRLT